MNNITLIWDIYLNSTNNLFKECKKIIEIDLSNIDSSNITEMESTFYECSSLISLNLSNFDTSKVTVMGYMFYGCSSLISLNLFNFHTSQVINMNSMFNQCSSLISLNLSNFNTSFVTIMEAMFCRCSLLISLNLSNFNTSKVTTMEAMFFECSSLTFLDLSNFNALLAGNSLDCIFSNCYKLEYINLKFSKINQNIYLSEYCSSHQPNLTFCSENEEWSRAFGLTDIQYINCINNITSFNIIETLNRVKCLTKKKEFNNICKIYGNIIFKKSELIDNIEYINCYQYKEDYYFDGLVLEYKSCYPTCKTCDKNGNETEHNCIVGKEEYIFEINLSIYKKCFKHLKKEIDIITEKNIKINNRTELIQNMINNLFNQLNISKIDTGKNKKINGNNISMIITSTKHQKNNQYDKMIIIDLGKCENILKNEYNISQNDSLYILQILSEEEGMKIPKIEYEVYYSSYNDNFTKLNLTLCKGTKIEISIPVKINDDLDKYNLNSGYYNDICYKTTSKNGTDINLKDRRNEYVQNNMALCEENCELIDYDAHEKVKCFCEIKTYLYPNFDFKFNKNDCYKSFTYIKNIANINVIKCYKIVFSIKNLINNFGFFFMAFIMFLYFITIIIFRFVSFKNLKNRII